MEKFIPYEKLSKKEKHKIDLAKRQTWGELNPVIRKPENSKAYNRKRTQDWKKELPDLRPIFVNLPISLHHDKSQPSHNQNNAVFCHGQRSRRTKFLFLQ